MLHRLREAGRAKCGLFSGPVEFDETYFGGRRKNMSNTKRRAALKTGRGPSRQDCRSRREGSGYQAGGGQGHQECGRRDPSEPSSWRSWLPEGKAYTDEAKGYKGIPHDHETVRHSVREYVHGEAHTNGIESFWSMLKRGYVGTYHKMSAKHLDRYVAEFQRRHNDRDSHTIEQMKSLVVDMAGKRLRRKDLTADNGLSSGARGGS